MMKEYSNKEIAVCWDPDKCIHAGECIKGLPQVFNRESRPWANIRGASSEEIMSAIDRCPSGALTYKINRKPDDAEKPSAQIRVMQNGPLLVEGNCILINREGKETISNGPFALCRCGGSKNKPLCDGSHIKIGFNDAL